MFIIKRWLQQFGKKEPFQKNDIFRIASQTKAITTTALMILFEEGKFLLDGPISKYIPAFKNPKVLDNFDPATLKYTTRPAKSEITIRQLLSHNAGITYDPSFIQKAGIPGPKLYFGRKRKIG